TTRRHSDCPSTPSDAGVHALDVVSDQTSTPPSCVSVDACRCSGDGVAGGGSTGVVVPPPPPPGGVSPGAAPPGPAAVAVAPPAASARSASSAMRRYPGTAGQLSP